MAWTKAQESAIYERGTNIIVSAGAGSGKTAVLSERILDYCLNGNDIRDVLVLTFTNAAALEMKERIRKKLIENNLTEQAILIDSADITTFDAYSLGLVKKYFYLLDLDKDLSIIDKSLLEIHKTEILDEMFMEMYNNKDNRFFNLLRKYTTQKDDPLKDIIINLSSKLELIVDEDFVINYKDKYLSDEFINKLVNKYEIIVLRKKNELLEEIRELSNLAALDPASIKIYDNAFDAINILTLCNTYDELKSKIETVSLGRLSSKNEVYVKQQKQVCDDLLKELKDKYLKKYLFINDAKEEINSIKDDVLFLLELSDNLNKKLLEYKYQIMCFDYVDIAKIAINLLKTNKEVREEIKYKLKEILIDEYQDTSDIQDVFVSLIENNNCYMVGDIKQSIYRFRNANPSIFKGKYDRYSKGDNGIKIDLTHNFRSRKEVLNNINLIFNKLMTNEFGDADYITEHQMNYGNTTYDEMCMDSFSYDQEYLTYEPDSMKIYSNDEIEVFIIANKIKQLMNNNTKVFDKDSNSLRPIKYSDISVIVPRKKNIGLIQKIFTGEGIPLNIAIDEKITDSPMIGLISSLLNLVTSVSSSDYKKYAFYFVSVARSFLFRQSDDLILRESLNYYKDNEIYEIAKRVNYYSRSHSVTKTFEYLLQEFNVYNSLIKIGDIDKHLSVINYLADMISNLCAYKYDLELIAKHFELIIDEEIEINYSNKTNANGVVLINIHKSKGLEYPICFFCDLTGGFNRTDIKESFLFDKYFGFITPYFSDAKEDTILKILYKHKYIKEDISERIRLFYVALTRAREKMYFVIPKIDYLKKVASPFLFNSYANFISYYYDEAIKKYVKEVNYDDKTHELAKDLVHFYADFDFYDFADKYAVWFIDYLGSLFETYKTRDGGRF